MLIGFLMLYWILSKFFRNQDIEKLGLMISKWLGIEIIKLFY